MFTLAKSMLVRGSKHGATTLSITTIRIMTLIITTFRTTTHSIMTLGVAF
jgi:hypothetical protein